MNKEEVKSINELVDDDHPSVEVFVDLLDRQLSEGGDYDPDSAYIHWRDDRRVHRLYGRCGIIHVSSPSKTTRCFAEYLNVITEDVLDYNRGYTDTSKEREMIIWHLKKARGMSKQIGWKDVLVSLESLISAIELKED